MQQLNQIIFVLFALILLGIYVSTTVDTKSKPDMYTSPYWRWSLLTRIVSYSAWGFAPLVDGRLLTLANMMMMASLALLYLLFRSWRVNVSRRVELLCVILIIVATIWFDYLRRQDGSFQDRMALIGTVVIVLDVLSLFELFKMHRFDQSGAFKVVVGMMVMQVVMTASLVVVTLVRNQHNVNVLIQHQSLIVLWSTMSAHLLLYIVVNSYLYRRLLLSKRRVQVALQENKQALDITTKEKDEIARLLAERGELIRSLIQANKTALTGALSASIAHEINQPVGAINLHIEYLKLKLRDDSEQSLMVMDVLQRIRHDADRIFAIISSMKQIFQQEEVESVETDLNEVVTTLSRILQSKADANQVQWILELNANQQVSLNRESFQQVILNLVNNAIDSAISSDRTNKKIRVATRDAGASVELIVSDNGPGISEDQRKALFSLMQTNKVNGLGLGLWLTRYIVDSHAGSIRIDNNPDGGVSVVVTLPACPPEA